MLVILVLIVLSHRSGFGIAFCQKLETLTDKLNPRSVHGKLCLHSLRLYYGLPSDAHHLLAEGINTSMNHKANASAYLY